MLRNGYRPSQSDRTMANAQTAVAPVCRILSLDGGGAKGFYTLGVLRELEAIIEGPIWQNFDLIFGTSTGAIIAALLGLGCTTAEVHELYQEHVPTIMRRRTRGGRSAALQELASKVFAGKAFTD